MSKRNYNNTLISLRDSKVGEPCPICWVIMTPSKENTFSSATIEHIDRLADGGKTCLTNIVICCKGCNSARGTVAQTLKRDNQLCFGYREWAALSLNGSDEFSQNVITRYYSSLDIMFWTLVSKRGISRPY
jgi:hypothetical protein